MLIKKNRLKTISILLLMITSTVVSGQTGPGGVGNSSSNMIWLKADEGIDATPNSRIDLWMDQSGNNFNAIQNLSTNRPTYQSSGPNGQPYIHFDRSAAVQYFEVTTPGVSSLVSNSNTIFIVGKANSGGTDNNTNAYQSFLTIPGYHSGIAVMGYPEANRIFMTNWFGSSVPGPGPTNALSNAAPLSQGSWNFLTRRIAENNGGSTASGFINGALISSVSNTFQMTDYTLDLLRIGTAFTSGTYTWALNGDIAEIIAYNKALNEAERIIVENYLSSKYNHTIENDKYSFDAANEYGADVAGIGRLDVTNQHLSAASDLMSIQDPSSLDDNDFILFGHNDQALVLDDMDAPSDKSRLRRVWRTDITGTPGSVSVSVKVNNFSLPPGQNFYLLVDGDGTFLNATQYSGTVSNNVFTSDTPIPLTDGDFITLAYSTSGTTAPVSLNYNPNTRVLVYGSDYTTQQPFVGDGGATASFALVNPPGGISINNATGEVHVDSHTTVGTYSLAISVSNNHGNSLFNDVFTIIIKPFTATKLNYSQQTVSFGNSFEPITSDLPENAFQYSIVSGSLNGLVLNNSTGEISGTMQSEGTASAVIRATPVAPNAYGSAINGTIVVSAIGSTGPAGVGSSLSNKFWLDVNHLTGVTNGTRMATFHDRSGNGWNAIQATSSRRPTYFLNQLNGKPAIRFDRTTAIQFMELTASGIGALMSNSNTIFAIAKANSGGADNSTNSFQSLIAVPGYHSTIAFSGYPTATGTFIINYVGGTIPGNPVSTYVSNSATFPQGTWQLISRKVSEATSTVQQSFLNGESMGSPATSSLPMNNYINNILRIGAALPSGQYSWPSNAFMTEIIAYNVSVNETQRLIVENYLSAKYALSISNDRYLSHDPAYTLDVEGIGTTDGSNSDKHSIASNSKGLKLQEINSSLNSTDEFLFAGHASNTNAIVNADLPVSTSQRWQRVWYVEKTGTMDVKLSFDFGDSGLPIPTDFANEYRFYQLLYRSAVTGIFTAVPVGPILENGDQIAFILQDTQLVNGYYTLGLSQGLVWTGVEDTDWNNPLNWNLTRVPLQTDKVVINSCTVCPQLNGDVSIAALALNSGSAISMGSHTINVTGSSFLIGANVESDNGKIQSLDFMEVKDSHFKGPILIEKTGGASNVWYGGNKFSHDLKILNFSSGSLQLATQADNLVKSF